MSDELKKLDERKRKRRNATMGLNTSVNDVTNYTENAILNKKEEINSIPFEEESIVEENSYSKEKKGSKKILIWFIVIFLIIVALGFLLKKYSHYFIIPDLDYSNIEMKVKDDKTEMTLDNITLLMADEARKMDDNTITINLSFINNSSDRTLDYYFSLANGPLVEGKKRIDNNNLRFDLIEVEASGEEKYLLEAVTYSKFTYFSNIPAKTMNEVSKKYKVRMWVDNNTKLAAGEDLANYFASIKVKVDSKTTKI